MNSLAKFIGTLGLLLITLSLHAQDSKVTSGIIAYADGDFKKAIQLFTEALDNRSSLKKKNIHNAYYYRAYSTILYIDRAITEKDMAWFTANPKAPLDAYLDSKKAAKDDGDAEWEGLVKNLKRHVRKKLIQYGLVSLTSLQKTKDKTLQLVHYENAMSFLKPASEIEEEYLVYDLMCQTEATKKFASESSLPYAEKAIALYKQDKPKTPDAYFFYAYYRKALVERYTKEDLEKAWETVKEGITFHEQEKKRVSQMTVEASKSKLLKQFSSVKDDLENFELDILLNSPKLLEIALIQFEKKIEGDPSNYTAHVAYASLLEKSDQEKAITIYQKAIVIDPTKELAYFNLGALYNNQAMVYYRKANDETDYTKAADWTKKVDAEFEKAYVQFKKSYEINPKNKETVNALVQICIRLEKMEEYKKYKDAKKLLQGG